MLRALTDEANSQGLPAVVFTFDHGDNPKSSTGLIASPEEKSRLLASFGVDAVFYARFSEIKGTSAKEFAERLIYEEFGAKSVVCGYDFRFGNNRDGDAELIKKLLSPKGVRVVTPQAVTVDGVPVSSTAIRALIAQGEIEKANKLLGRCFSFSGEVVHGKKLGRTLGFPTINQKYPSCLTRLRYGVYAVRCHIGDAVYGGVANLGVKPTVSDADEPICETYMFGYSGDCYGKEVKIDFVKEIRPEKRFSSLEELASSVEQDKRTAEKILNEGV